MCDAMSKRTITKTTATKIMFWGRALRVGARRSRH
jgi:hypothetical protein